ncbi:MAG: cyclic nucleotide-binding domain-containing protein, partial [Rhodoferax sp.]
DMRRVQSLDVTATHVLEQVKKQLEKHGAYLIFCDIPKGLPSGLKMKRFLKDTGVVQDSEKAFAFRQVEDALKWMIEREHPYCPVEFQPDTALDLNLMPVLAACPVQDVSALQQAVQLSQVALDKKLFRPGQGDDCLYLVRSGRFRVDLVVGKHAHLQVAFFGPGEVLSGNRFLQGEAVSGEAIAVQDSQVYTLSRSAFDALAQKHGTVAAALLSALARKATNQLEQALLQSQSAPA